MNLLNQMSFVAGDCLPVLTGLPCRSIIESLPSNWREYLSTHLKGEFSSSFLSGGQLPLLRGFFTPSKNQNGINPFIFYGLYHWATLVVGRARYDTANSMIQSANQCLAAAERGLNPQISGITAMNASNIGEPTPQIPLKQTSIADLLIHALQELSHIETLSCLDCDSSCVLPSIFQHSQRGLNALHDLKNRLSIENVRT